MTRLTKSIKEKIVKNALNQAGINDEKLILRKRRAELAESVRVAGLGGSEAISEIEKNIKKIEKIQGGSCLKGVRRSEFGVMEDYDMGGVNFAGSQVILYFNGGFNYHDGDNVYKKILPKSSKLAFTADHPLTIEFLDIERATNELQGRSNMISSQVAGSLLPFTTIKKLLKAWPEVKELLPESVEESKPQLPMVLVKDLNKLIGLPK